MIYLPHPLFDFENSQGGIIGYAKYAKPIKLILGRPYKPSQIIGTDDRIWNINVDKVVSKFYKARFTTSFRSKALADTQSYGFLREDGNEFAIRFLRSQHIVMDGEWGQAIAVVGYWVYSATASTKVGPAIKPEDINKFNEFKIWLETECPT